MKGISVGIATVVIVCAMAFSDQQQTEQKMVSEGFGISAKYPGDVGIEKDEDVVFVESFETGGIGDFKSRWDNVSNDGGKVMSFSEDIPEASSGKRALSMTATRGENSGGHLFRVFKPGNDRLYARFYVRFALDYGFNHHFVKLQGAIDPPSYPTGGAGNRPTDSWTTGIEPAGASHHKYPAKAFPPPGIWHFYTYWIEMRSWQGPDGTSFYGNNFEPKDPIIIPRDRWICVEFSVKMNSSPEESDGEQTFWIDGKPVGHFAPGSVIGYWMRDKFRLDETDERAKAFEGFRWRKDMRLNVNKFWLLHYVSENAFKKNDEYAAEHPNFLINTDTATVWFDDIVIAKKYVGPIKN